jgi:hypothetical protein
MNSEEIALEFDEKKKIAKNGSEYWMARHLQAILGYEDWRNFANSIERAKQSCEVSGVDPSHHFVGTTTMVDIGSGAKRNMDDYYLSRYACYLIAMNGEPTKPEIGAVQAYFAVQTRRQEITDQLVPCSENEKTMSPQNISCATLAHSGTTNKPEIGELRRIICRLSSRLDPAGRGVILKRPQDVKIVFNRVDPSKCLKKRGSLLCLA